MSAPAMTKRIAEMSPSAMARTAGGLSFLSITAAVLGESVVPRFEVAGDLIALTAILGQTVLLYFLFKPVSSRLSLLAACMNFVGVVCGAFRWTPMGVDLPVVCDGFYCFVIGYLIFRSSFLPRILGVLIAIAGLGWVTYLSPHFAAHISPYNLAAGILGQESVMLWLLVRGVKDGGEPQDRLIPE